MITRAINGEASPGTTNACPTNKFKRTGTLGNKTSIGINTLRSSGRNTRLNNPWPGNLRPGNPRPGNPRPGNLRPSSRNTMLNNPKSSSNNPSNQTKAK